MEISDEDFLVDEPDGYTGPEEETPRQKKRRQLAEALPMLQELAKNLPRLSLAERREALKMFDDAEKLGCELSLATFYKCAWQQLDPAPYKHNWHIDATAQKAEQLITGECRRLIVNQPPRTGKSNLLSVVLPVWVWIQSMKGPMSGPQVKFLCASYGQSLSLKHSGDCRKLIQSPWFQKHWGDRFKLLDDRNAVGFFENNKGGYRMATSVGAGLTGQGGDFIIIDDPHNTQEVVSEAERTAAINWYTQSLSTRLNDPKTGVMLLVMQRQHQEDLTGYLFDNEGDMWESFVLRMRYEANPFLDYDLRGYDEDGEPLSPFGPGGELGPEGDPFPASPLGIVNGELLWPDRIPEEECSKLERTLGSYGTAGQLQQRPTTKGGEIIRARDWKIFPPPGQEDDWKKDGQICWPPFDFVLASLDGAYTEKEENDPSALTFWGVWRDRTGWPRVVAVHAWEDFLSFNPLCMRVGNNCRKFKPDVLIIESKANGISVAQEIQRVFGNAEWSTVLVPAKGDKVARALSVQGLFEEGVVYAPNREWAQLLIDRCSAFPKGKRKDLVDSTTQALRWLRDNGLLQRKDEYTRNMLMAMPVPGESFMQELPYDV